MKIKSLSLALAGFVMAATANGAVTMLFENFDSSTSLPAGWSINNNVSIRTDSDYAFSGNNTLSINESKDSNFVTTPSINLTGATEATLSFYWTTGPNSSAFGRIPQIQYSADGTNFTTLGEVTLPANIASVTAPALFTATITSAGGFAFTADSRFRIVGDNDAGGGGAPFAMDDFTVTSNIPEPTTALLGGLGLIVLLRRRR